MRLALPSKVRRAAPAALAALLPLAASTNVFAQPQVECHVITLVPDAGGDLGGRFQYAVSAVAEEPFELESVLLVLGRTGEVIQEIPVADGDLFQFALRDEITIRAVGPEPGRGHTPAANPRLLVYAPGVLFRARAQSGFESALAYCSPYAAIRVDQPEDAVFVTTTATPDAAAHIVVGVAQMEPASIQITVDCVDILEATGAVLPGGPFDGVVEIASTPVTISDLTGDLEQGTITFTLEGLPGGSHLVRVEGTPVYLDELPPGHPQWQRPLGALEHERQISIFAVEIQQPTAGENVPLAATTIQGVITHGEPPTSLRVHGATVALPAATFVPGDGCVGDAYRVEFAQELPVANLEQDFDTGNDVLSALDPGVNFVSALATDAGGHVANDRVRFSLGDVVSGLAVREARATIADKRRMDTVAGDECVPAEEVPGFVRNGFAVSLSEAALERAIRTKILPDLTTELESALDDMVGTSVEAQIDPCTAESAVQDAIASGVQIRYRGQSYDLRTLASILAPTAAHGVRSSGAGLGTQVAERAPALRVSEPRVLGGNEPPVFVEIPDQTIETNHTLVIQLEASDPDDDPVTFSGETLPDNSRVVEDRFEFHPACDQLGDHTVTVVASDGTDTDTETFTVTVEAVDVPETYNAEFTSASFDPASVTLSVALTGADEISLTFETGPISFGLHAGDCYGDCVFCCCASWGVDFDILMDNVRITTHLTPEQILCGVADPLDVPAPEVEIEGLAVDFEDLDIGGCFAWLVPEVLLAQLLDAFGADAAILNAFFADDVVDRIDDQVHDAIVNQFPGFEFSGLREMEFDTDLPAESPVTLATQFSDLPTVEPGEAISLGIHTMFAAIETPDPAVDWFPTFSAVPHLGGDLDGDFLISTSDDALNQLMSELATAGTLRETIDGFTVGDFVPGYSDEDAGITPETPIVVTVDAAQDADGNCVPPIIGFIDQEDTEAVELKVRTQLLVRVILPREGTVTEDRGLCGCTTECPAGASTPCLFLETLLKLNFLVDASVTPWDPVEGVSLDLVITEVQQLEREGGFDCFEPTDFTDDEDQIVATSEDNPVLADLRDRLNDAVQPFDVQPDALTLGGWVEPTNVRLFAATVDDAGHGFQDYFGLQADLADEALVAARNSGRRRVVLREQVLDRRRQAPPATRDEATAAASARRAALAAGAIVTHVSPNPFNPATTVRAELPAPSDYLLSIYNMAGGVVRSWKGTAGERRLAVRWDGKDASGRTVPAGIYVYRLQTQTATARGKLVLVK